MSHSAKAQLFRRTLNAAREVNLPNLPALPEAAQDVWNELSGGATSNNNSNHNNNSAYQQQAQGFRLPRGGFARQTLGAGAGSGAGLPRPPLQSAFHAYPPRTQPPSSLQGSLRGPTTPYGHLDLGLNRPTNGIPVLWQQQQQRQQHVSGRGPAAAAIGAAGALPPPPPPPPRTAAAAGTQLGLDSSAASMQHSSVFASVPSSSGASTGTATAPAAHTAAGADASNESAARHLAAIAAALSPPGAQPAAAAAAAAALTAPPPATAQQLLVSHVQQVHAAFAVQQRQQQLQNCGAVASTPSSSTAQQASAQPASGNAAGGPAASGTVNQLANSNLQSQAAAGSGNWDPQGHLSRGQPQFGAGKQPYLKRPRNAADFAAPRSSLNSGNSLASNGLHGTNGMSSVALNRLIMGAPSTTDLLSVVRAHGPHFDFFNISSAIARVPKLVAAQGGGGGNGGNSHNHMDDGSHHGRSSHNGSANGVQQHQQFAHEHGHAASADHSHSHAVPFHHGSGHGAGPHLDPPGHALVASLARLMADRIESFDARGLANSAWALGKLRDGSLGPLVGKETMRRLEGPGRGGFSAQNLANLVWSFVYMGHRDEALLQVMAEQVVERVHEFKPQELANILWSYASLDYHHERMVARVAARMVEMGGVFKEQELANALWALAKLHTRGGGGANNLASTAAFDALLGQAKSQLHQFMPQGISNTVWAMAAMGHRDSGMLSRVVEHCQGQLGAYDVQALANLAWSLATLGFYDPRFMSALLRECTNRLHLLSPQNVSNTLWACATLGHVDDRMLSTWSRHVGERLSSFEPQGLSNSAWALAKLGVRDAALWEAVASAALPKLASFTPQGLANLSWAFATAQYAHPTLFEAIADRSLLQLASFNAQNCGVLAWSFGTARHYSPALLDSLAVRLASQLSGPAAAAAAEGACEPQHLAHAMWAFARFDHALGPAGPVLQQACVSLLPRMAQQDVCGSLSALASLQLLDAESFERYSQRLARATDLSAEELQQVYHAQLLMHADAQLEFRRASAPLHLPSAADLGFASGSSDSSRNGSGSFSNLDNWVATAPSKFGAPSAASLPRGNASTAVSSYGHSAPFATAELAQQPALPPHLQAAAASAWLNNPASSSAVTLPSPAHLDVAAALASVGVPAALNSWTEDGQLSVGLALQVLATDGQAHSVALEVVGPQDMSSNEPSLALGEVQARKRLLEARGWQVVNVDACEWNDANYGRPSAPQERAEQLLCRIADTIGVQPSDWQEVTSPAPARPVTSWNEEVTSALGTALGGAGGGRTAIVDSSSWLQQAASMQGQEVDQMGLLVDDALEMAGAWYGGQAYSQGFNLGSQTNVQLHGVGSGNWTQQAVLNMQQQQTMAHQQQQYQQQGIQQQSMQQQPAQHSPQGERQQLQQPHAQQQIWNLSSGAPFAGSIGNSMVQQPHLARRASPVHWSEADAADEWQALSWQAGGAGQLSAGADSASSSRPLIFSTRPAESSIAIAASGFLDSPTLLTGSHSGPGSTNVSHGSSSHAVFTPLQDLLGGSSGSSSAWTAATGQRGLGLSGWGQLPSLQRAASLTSCDSNDPDLLLLGRHEAAVAALLQ